MADYYYATVRTYVSLSNSTLTADELKNNVTSDPIIISDNTLDLEKGTQHVWYLFTVYKSSTSSFEVWKGLPKDSKGDILKGKSTKRVLVSTPSSDTVYKNTDDVNKYIETDSIHDYNDNFVALIRNANYGDPRSIHFKNWFVFAYKDGVEIPVTNVVWYNKAKKPPVIKITGAGQRPAYPNDVQKWLEKAAPEGPSVGKTIAEAKAYAKANLTISNGDRWSICRKKWYYLVVDNLEGTATLWESDEAGKIYKMSLGKKPSFPNQKSKTAWSNINAEELKKAMDPATCVEGSGEVPPVTGSDFNVEVVPPKDANRYNPPPHAASRSVPYMIRSADNSTDPEKATFAGLQNSANFNSQSAEYISYVKGYKYLERGKIFQDALSASVLNQVNTGGKPPGKGEANQWGFRFMYNPTSFSYSTAANNSIDWTYGSKDTAALLAGNQTVQLQLYLNRIVDLNYLNVLYGNTSNKIGQDIYNQVSPTIAYGRELSLQEREGILNRGTEYDLEFLYRCLTGDPQTNNPLLNDNLRKTGSADIGYITGIPLWLYLNDNLRYFGSVSGFEVNHLIFNTEMVPTLSVVTLSFGRYPAQFANDAASLQSVRDNFFPPATDG